MASGVTGVAPALAPVPARTIDTLTMSEEIVDKLHILDYETLFCKPRCVRAWTREDTPAPACVPKLTSPRPT